MTLVWSVLQLPFQDWCSMAQGDPSYHLNQKVLDSKSSLTCLLVLNSISKLRETAWRGWRCSKPKNTVRSSEGVTTVSSWSPILRGTAVSCPYVSKRRNGCEIQFELCMLVHLCSFEVLMLLFLFFVPVNQMMMMIVLLILGTIFIHERDSDLSRVKGTATSSKMCASSTFLIIIEHIWLLVKIVSGELIHY